MASKSESKAYSPSVIVRSFHLVPDERLVLLRFHQLLKENDMTRQHVIVVGGGPGGLATALRLLGQGYTVQLFESADRVGGRMRGLTTLSTPVPPFSKCPNSMMRSLPVRA